MNKYFGFGLFVVLFLAFWNLLDFLYSTVITGNGYQFGAGADLGLPLVVAIVVGVLLFLRNGDK